MSKRLVSRRIALLASASGLVLAVAILFLLDWQQVTRSVQAQEGCDVPNTPFFTEYYGDVTLDGASAPIDTVVEAFNADGVRTGCFVVVVPGAYGYLRVYGADADTGTPGMSAGEPVILKVNGSSADTVPADVTWSDDQDQHSVDLSAISVPDPVDDLAISIDDVDVDLVWSDVGGTVDHYEVWRSSVPYFTPGDDNSVRVCSDVPANAGGSVTCPDTTGHMGNPAVNDYYVVLAANSNGDLSALSNSMSIFDFALQPGESSR